MYIYFTCWIFYYIHVFNTLITNPNYYSFEYEPKAMDDEDKNLEHFNTFADETNIPSVSASSKAFLSFFDKLHKFYCTNFIQIDSNILMHFYWILNLLYINQNT